MQPHFFTTPQDFRAWLEKHHRTATELIVGFHKKASGMPSITWPESVDQALCFGWIDGIRRSIDDASYTIRFTPRKSGSTWSAKNIARVAELTEMGLMRSAGVAEFERRSEARSGVYSFEQETIELGRAYERRFRALPGRVGVLPGAAAVVPPGRHVVGDQRQEGGDRLRRLEKLIDESTKGRRIT